VAKKREASPFLPSKKGSVPFSPFLRGVAKKGKRPLFSAHNVACYAPTHTFVEKLQTISTKCRRLALTDTFPANFLRHYYDVYCLLDHDEVKRFMGTPAFEKHKRKRFRTEDEFVIAQNPAFRLSNKRQREQFAAEYRKTAALYYQGQPDFNLVLARIRAHISQM
jgi:hypothetical protein